MSDKLEPAVPEVNKEGVGWVICAKKAGGGDKWRPLITPALEKAGRWKNPFMMIGLTQEECSAFGWGKVLHPDDAEAAMAVESSGVGLAIVKKAVESQRGAITLISAPGQGSTFRFTWPVDTVLTQS